MDESWFRLAASLGIGLLIGLERERNPAAKAGVRTFALVALAGALAALLDVQLQSAWLVPVGLAAVAGMLIAAHARGAPQEDPRGPREEARTWQSMAAPNLSSC